MKHNQAPLKAHLLAPVTLAFVLTACSNETPDQPQPTQAVTVVPKSAESCSPIETNIVPGQSINYEAAGIRIHNRVQPVAPHQTTVEVTSGNPPVTVLLNDYSNKVFGFDNGNHLDVEVTPLQDSPVVHLVGQYCTAAASGNA